MNSAVGVVLLVIGSVGPVSLSLDMPFECGEGLLPLSLVLYLPLWPWLDPVDRDIESDLVLSPLLRTHSIHLCASHTLHHDDVNSISRS